MTLMLLFYSDLVKHLWRLWFLNDNEHGYSKSLYREGHTEVSDLSEWVVYVFWILHCLVLLEFDWASLFMGQTHKKHMESQIHLNMWCDLGKSVWSRTCDVFQFSMCLKCSFGEVHFAENSTWIGPVVSKLWAIIKDSQNSQKILFFSGHISQSMLPTSDWFW